MFLDSLAANGVSITSMDLVERMDKCLQTFDSNNNNKLINDISAENPNANNHENNVAPNMSSNILSKNTFVVSSDTTSSLPASEEYLKQLPVDINYNFPCNSKSLSQDGINENGEESIKVERRSERPKKRNLTYKDDYVYDFNKRKFQPGWYILS